MWMNVLLLVTVLGNLGFSAWLLQRCRRLRRELAEAQLKMDEYGADAGVNLPPSAGSRPLISVAILNPMELAMKESQLARMFGHLTPELVQREVYREIHQRLSTQLVEQGVVAEVTLHDARA